MQRMCDSSKLSNSADYVNKHGFYLIIPNAESKRAHVVADRLSYFQCVCFVLNCSLCCIKEQLFLTVIALNAKLRY